jgi:hypothetical protein
MLYKCRDLIESRVIKPEYCLEIMDFFSDHMNSKKLANCSDEDVFKKLKGIPLHVSVSGDHMDIPSNQSVLVMDDIEVTDGIAEWAMHSSTLLLQTTPKLRRPHLNNWLTFYYSYGQKRNPLFPNSIPVL